MADDTTTRRKISIWVWLVVALVVFGMSMGAGFLAATWQGQKLLVVDNKQGLFVHEVSQEGMKEYLKYAGLSEQVKQVVLTYEPVPLEKYAYTRELSDTTLDVMMDLAVEEKVVKVWLYYNPDLFGYMLESPERIEGEVLAGVCLALNPGTMPTCMKQAFEYIEWAKGEGIMPAIRPTTKQSWWRILVPQAYAACSGTIPCGADKTVCSCSVGSGGGCSYTGQSCNTFGTCSCPVTCDETKNRLNCSALTTQQLCTTQGSLSSCATKCSAARPAENYCSWSSGGVVPPPPIGATATTAPVPPGGSCSARFKVKGFAYNRNMSAIRSVKVAEVIYSDNSRSDLIANGTTGEFSIDRCWDNLPKGNFRVKSVGVAGLAGVLKPNGSPGGGCTIDSANSQYANCNMNSFAFSASSNAGGGFNFLEQVTANPNCSVPKISDTSRNCNGDGKSVTVSWNSTNRTYAGSIEIEG
jgi:hypothetical protein